MSMCAYKCCVFVIYRSVLMCKTEAYIWINDMLKSVEKSPRANIIMLQRELKIAAGVV